MNRDANDYLIPLQMAEGSLPLGQLLYQATGEVAPGGTWPSAALDDLDELCEDGLIRIESRHSARHRRVEKTIWLTETGQKACENDLDTAHYERFAEKEAGLRHAADTVRESAQ